MIAVKSQREHFLAKKLWIQILMWAFFGKKVVDSNPKVSILRQKKLWVQILMWAYYGKSYKFKYQCEHFFFFLLWIQILMWAFSGNKLWIKIQMWAFSGKKVVNSIPSVSIFWQKFQILTHRWTKKDFCILSYVNFLHSFKWP